MRQALCLLAFCLALPAAADPPPAGPLLDEAFRSAQAAMASAAGSALRQIGVRAAAGDGALADLLRDRQGLLEDLVAVQEALAAPGADTVALAGEADALAARIAGLDQRLAADFPRFADLTRPRAMAVAEVQAALAPDEALILTYVGDYSTFVFAVSKDAAGWHRLALPRTEIARVVGVLRGGLDPAAASRAAEPLHDVDASRAAFSRYRAAQVYDFLLWPLEPVFGAARHVFVVPDGPLTGLPFGLLVTTYPEGDDADPAVLRETDWMIRRHALTTLPAVESLRVVRAMPPPAAGRVAFAGFGDPVLGGRLDAAAVGRGAGLMRAGLADAEQLRALAPLPQTARELRALARSLGAGPATVRLGPEATEAAVKAADLSRTRVLAFATHGLLSGDIAGLAEPALVLTPPDTPSIADDGLLTASEIAELSLDADWVLLSACNTAGGAEPGAEGLSGLARAFFFAGARSILVSHWPVRDDAAARLTTVALDRLESGAARGRAEALQQAMLALMADPSDPTLAHPAAWAPFVVVGEGGVAP
jgi:CHAT domain-containing protein